MRVRVEVADTPYKLAKGLMFRQLLPADAGMLFLFPRQQILGFWGENTLIPLDIAFVGRDNKISKIARIEKLSKKSVLSDVPCTMAIEVNAGYFEKHEIKVGDAIKVEDDKFDGTVVSFEKIAGNRELSGEQQIKTAWFWDKWLGKGKNKTSPPPADGQPTLDLPSGDQVQPPNPQRQTAEQPLNLNNEQSALPEVSLDDIGFADDDASEGDTEQDNSQNEQPGMRDEEPENGQESIPDASSMSTQEAVQEAIDNGYVMWINYMTSPKKRTIGPSTGNKQVLRIIQPHGIIQAKTTGNTILVTWDMTVNDFRAFIVNRIQEKAFTGQRFEKWFTVKQ